MNKKLKLALAALLGFSAACSTVKNAPTRGENGQEQESGATGVADSVSRPRIIVMYGVRYPGSDNPGTPLPFEGPDAQAPESGQSGAAGGTPATGAGEAPAVKPARE